MIPLRDENRSRTTPHITRILLLANIIVFIPILYYARAISGVMGAYILMYPKARILTLVLFRLAFLVPIPAAIFLGVWFVLQLLHTSIGIGGGVAYWAHIGGFIAGMISVFVFKRIRARTKLKEEPAF